MDPRQGTTALVILELLQPHKSTCVPCCYPLSKIMNIQWHICRKFSQNWSAGSKVEGWSHTKVWWPHKSTIFHEGIKVNNNNEHISWTKYRKLSKKSYTNTPLSYRFWIYYILLRDWIIYWSISHIHIKTCQVKVLALTKSIFYTMYRSVSQAASTEENL